MPAGLVPSEAFENLLPSTCLASGRKKKKGGSVSHSVVSSFFDSMDCSPPGSSAHGILQERILEWVVILFFRVSSWLRDQIWPSCFAGRLFTIWATRETSFWWLPVILSIAWLETALLWSLPLQCPSSPCISLSVLYSLCKYMGHWMSMSNPIWSHLNY